MFSDILAIWSKTTSIDTIEAATNLDFLHELPDTIEDAIESKTSPLWDDIE